VRLEGGEKYYVLPGSSVNTLPGVSSGTEGHTAWEFKEGSTANVGLQRAEALEATRIAYRRQSEIAEGRILGSKKMIAAAAVTAVSGGAALALAPAGVVGGIVYGAGEGAVIGGALTAIDGGNPREVFTKGAALGGVSGGIFGLVGKGIGAVRGPQYRTLAEARAGFGIPATRGPASVLPARDATAAKGGGTQTAEAVRQGFVREGGKLQEVLQNIESEFAAAAPKSAGDALTVIDRATSAAKLEPGVASLAPDGGVILENAGGITTTISKAGDIIIQRGDQVLMRLKR
jgi:hypothetical protein